MPPELPQRYDLSATRILSRALRYQRRLTELLAPDFSGQAGPAAQTLVADLVWFRLAEDYGLLPPRFYPEFAETLPRLVTEFNRIAGGRLFQPEHYAVSPEVQELLLTWDRELRRPKFWPAGRPVHLVGLVAVVLSQGSSAVGRAYPPGAIQARLMDWALASWPKKSGADFALLDPACGLGFFLLGAFGRMLAREEEALRRRAPLFLGAAARPALDPLGRWELFQQHFFGVEADAASLTATRRALFLLLMEGTNLLEGPKPLGAALFQNLRGGDVLLDHPIAWQEGLFNSSRRLPAPPFPWSDPEQGFGRVLSRGGFHAMLGHPPWAALKGKGHLPVYPPEVVDYLIHRYQTGSSRPSLFEFYLRRGLEFLAPGGVLAFLLPARMVSGPRFAGLRRFLLEQGEVLNLHYGEPFPGVVTPTVCFHFQKTPRPRHHYTIPVTDAEGTGFGLPSRKFSAAEVSPPARLNEWDPEPLLRRMESGAKKRLADFFSAGVGLIARPGKITEQRRSAQQLRVVRAEHVQRYVREGVSYLEFNPRHLAGGTRRRDKLTRRDRLLVRKTGAGLAAVRDDSGDLPEQSLYFLHLRPRRLCRGYDLRYFLGLLNSQVLTFYYRFRWKNRPGAPVQISKAELERLPLPVINWRDPAQAEIHRRLAEAVARREQAAAKDAWDLDLEIERLVARLYGLEAALVEQIGRIMKQAGGGRGRRRKPDVPSERIPG